jgi:hypothetical protein
MVYTLGQLLTLFLFLGHLLCLGLLLIGPSLLFRYCYL